MIQLLGLRFGDLPEAVVHRIQAADAALLNGWIERVVTATTLPEVLGET